MVALERRETLFSLMTASTFVSMCFFSQFSLLFIQIKWEELSLLQSSISVMHYYFWHFIGLSPCWAWVLMVVCLICLFNQVCLGLISNNQVKYMSVNLSVLWPLVNMAYSSLASEKKKEIPKKQSNAPMTPIHLGLVDTANFADICNMITGDLL